MGKSNNQDEKNRDKYNKRSNKFDDLLGSSPNNRPNNLSTLSTKEKIKKIWKWISIFIYLFFAGLGFTGLIQSCVLQTNSTVGAGIELYKSKNEVAPYVSTYKVEIVEEWVIEYDDNGNPILDQNGQFKKTKKKFYVLNKYEKSNYLASKDTINELKSGLENLYGENGKDISSLYGNYNNYSSSLRIIGLENIPINSRNNNLSGDLESPELIKGTKETNNYLFINNKMLDYLNKDTSLSYIPVNNWYDVSYFVVSRPENWDQLTSSQKDYYGQGITNLEYAFQAFENVGTETNPNWVKVDVLNGEYVTLDVNGDGIIDTETYVKITDQERISKFKYSLNAEVATVKKDELISSEKFALDYLQSLVNVLVHFPQLNDFYEIINEKTNSNITSEDDEATILNALSANNLKQLTNERVITRDNKIDDRAFDQNKLFTLKQKNAIITYQNLLSSLMEKIGFGIRKQVYSDEQSLNYSDSKDNPFIIVFQPNINNKKDLIVGTNSIAQKPITSWSDSWRLGPFYGLIVYPLSYIINSMMSSMPPMSGWDGVIAIVLTILLTRVIVTLFTYKSLFSQHKQQQLNPKKAKIDAKYAPFKGNREMEQRKRQELSKLYKSNNISMIDPIKAMCLSMPIFFAVWRVVQGIPDIKVTTWLGIQFSLTSWRELFSGQWQYFPLLLIAVLTQATSHLLPRFLNKKRLDERANRAEKAALKKSNKMQNIVTVVFIFMSVIFEAGVQIYWIVSGLWQIMQVLVVHHIVRSNWYRTKGYKYV